jgi:hypothetical protein
MFTYKQFALSTSWAFITQYTGENILGHGAKVLKKTMGAYASNTCSILMPRDPFTKIAQLFKFCA